MTMTDAEASRSIHRRVAIRAPLISLRMLRIPRDSRGARVNIFVDANLEDEQECGLRDASMMRAAQRARCASP